MQERKVSQAPDLFSPFKVCRLELQNRVVMAPLTRSRAGPGNVPTQLNALYYAQRASAGLIIAEATQVAPEGQGYISTPGIHSAEQIEGWKCVTKAVHIAGGHIVLQLWHVGRISHPSFQPCYGGSIENRCRFLLEVVDAVTAAAGAERTGVRISPQNTQNDIADSNPQALFDYVAERLSGKGLAFLHVIEGDTSGIPVPPFDYMNIKRLFGGPVIANNGFDKARANETLAEGRADFIAFGKPFISNPDLVIRLFLDAPLVPLNRETLYGGAEQGYTDYPILGAVAPHACYHDGERAWG